MDQAEVVYREAYNVEEIRDTGVSRVWRTFVYALLLSWLEKDVSLSLVILIEASFIM